MTDPITAQAAYDQAAEQLRLASDPEDLQDATLRLDISDRWRWLADSLRGPRPDLSPIPTDSRIERASQWDHDRRQPIGFRS